MAHYYSTIKGHRGQASRCGSKTSGITTTANSYSVGATVDINYSEKLQTDIVTIYHTQGSDSRPERLISYAIVNNQFTILDNNFPELLV
jgi:hypothetical protein